MAAVSNRRAVMTLYSGVSDPESHRTRIALAEKGIAAGIIEVRDQSMMPEDLIELNPYHTLPTLVDRDLALYNSRIIMEYLDERFPHPPLLPVDPVSRARTRLFLYRVEKDWYSLLDDLASNDEAKANESRKSLRDSLLAISPIFLHKPFFMSDEFSIVDCSVAPILWRLKHYQVELPLQAAKALNQYAERLFAREAFRKSLTDSERELR
jgi:RNA polymerase-associated protein